MNIIVTPSSINDFKLYEDATICVVGNSSFCEGYPYSYSCDEILLAID